MGQLGFVGIVLTSIVHIMATYWTVRVARVLPMLFGISLLGLSIISFVSEMLTFSQAATFNMSSGDLLRKFEMAANYWEEGAIRRKVYVRQVKALRKIGLSIGLLEHRFFICSRFTVLTVLKELTNQTINTLISF